MHSPPLSCGGSAHNVLLVVVLTNFDSKHFLCAIHVVSIECAIIVVVTVFVVWEFGLSKLVLPSEKLYIQQLIDQMAHNFASALRKVFNAAILSDLNTEFSHVIDHFLQCLRDVALVVFEVYENSKFPSLQRF